MRAPPTGPARMPFDSQAQELLAIRCQTREAPAHTVQGSPRYPGSVTGRSRMAVRGRPSSSISIVGRTVQKLSHARCGGRATIAHRIRISLGSQREEGAMDRPASYHGGSAVARPRRVRVGSTPAQGRSGGAGRYSYRRPSSRGDEIRGAINVAVYTGRTHRHDRHVRAPSRYLRSLRHLA